MRRIVQILRHTSRPNSLDLTSKKTYVFPLILAGVSAQANCEYESKDLKRAKIKHP